MQLTGPGSNGESWRNQVHEMVSGTPMRRWPRYAGCEVRSSAAMTLRVTAGSPRRWRSRRGARAWRPLLAGHGGASSRWNWFVRGDHAWARK
jgi:hypothetical protein